MGWNGETLFRHLVTPANVNFELARKRGSNAAGQTQSVLPCRPGISLITQARKINTASWAEGQAFLQLFLHKKTLRASNAKNLPSFGGQKAFYPEWEHDSCKIEAYFQQPRGRAPADKTLTNKRQSHTRHIVGLRKHRHGGLRKDLRTHKLGHF